MLMLDTIDVSPPRVTSSDVKFNTYTRQMKLQDNY